MAGRGAPRDPNSIRAKDHKDIVETTTVGKNPKLRGKPLPEDVTWHSCTLTWWENWRRSPLAENFGTTDWDFLLETAFLHTEFWNGTHSLAAELRLRVSKFGATPLDRLTLRLEITNPENDSMDKPKTKSSNKKPAMSSDRKSKLSIVPPITA